MPIFSKQSLELLREKVDLIEVLSSHIQLKPSGSSYKALCPFHEERTPSFMVQRGSSHYHCFGCGAHGDAISFLMHHLKLNFSEAVESLAERFQVPLEQETEEKQQVSIPKSALKTLLNDACSFFHYYLLHSQEGQEVLKYLYQRGIDLDFIYLFQIGLAPKSSSIFFHAMKQRKWNKNLSEMAGLLRVYNEKSVRPFFLQRILFPILDTSGNVIGFSGRKVTEEQVGPKYLNTPETPIFKKSQVLYGLSFCRKRITKEKKAIIVEGQIDALRMIQEGFTITVAGQGTAFTADHAKLLIQLGVETVYLALDQDRAGKEAAVKIGSLFQKEGIEVFVAKLPEGMDPDSVLNEKGPKKMQELLGESLRYLPFLYEFYSEGIDLNSPSKKNQVVQAITRIIRSWDHPLMVHESLRMLAELTKLPEKIIGMSGPPPIRPILKKQGHISQLEIDPDRILEVDLLRWLLLFGKSNPLVMGLIEDNIQSKHFKIPICRRLFDLYFTLTKEEKETDFLSLTIAFDDAEGQMLISEILQKKVNEEKIFVGMKETILKMLQRYWMEERERIKMKIHSGTYSEEEVLKLAKEFDALKGEAPQIHIREEYARP